MRPTFYSMWLEGSARKAPAQRAPFAETPICLPHCLPQRDFLASFCNRKIQKVIVPSAQTEIFARQVSALPPKADIHRRDKVSGARAREHHWRGRCWSKTAAQKPFDGTHTRSVRIAPAWSKSNIAARLRASRQYHGLDLTGRRGSFTRSSLLAFLQARASKQQLKSHLLGLTRGRRDGEKRRPPLSATTLGSVGAVVNGKYCSHPWHFLEGRFLRSSTVQHIPHRREFEVGPWAKAPVSLRSTAYAKRSIGRLDLVGAAL